MSETLAVVLLGMAIILIAPEVCDVIHLMTKEDK